MSDRRPVGQGVNVINDRARILFPLGRFKFDHVRPVGVDEEPSSQLVGVVAVYVHAGRFLLLAVAILAELDPPRTRGLVGLNVERDQRSLDGLDIAAVDLLQGGRLAVPFPFSLNIEWEFEIVVNR